MKNSLIRDNPRMSQDFPNCEMSLRTVILKLFKNLKGDRMLTDILIWVLLGALAGWIASMIMGRNAQMGALANILVGIVGALIGGFLMNAFGAPGVTGFNIYSILVAIGGAVVLLFLVGAVRRA
jgi:uncharacterized membrane protein YeaQ/YmgE (transglycosylase-associated protein family)